MDAQNGRDFVRAHLIAREHHMTLLTSSLGVEASRSMNPLIKRRRRNVSHLHRDSVFPDFDVEGSAELEWTMM